MNSSIKLTDVNLFQELTAPELKKIGPYLIEKGYKKNDILFFEGDSCNRIFIVRSGRIKIFRTSSSGREQILEVLEPGDTCACNPGSKIWHCSSSAQAETDSEVWFFSRVQYVKLVSENSKLARTLNQIFAKRLCQFSSLIENIALEDPEKRLVKFILDMHSDQIFQCDEDSCLCIPFTHEEISQRLGLVRETVTRHLNKLKRLKLIDIHPQQIIVNDKKGLQDILL